MRTRCAPCCEPLYYAQYSQTEELHYIYQRLGFHHLSLTLFSTAGTFFFNGHLDPRILISYFPSLRGGLFGPSDHVLVYQGIEAHMPKEANIDEIGVYLGDTSHKRKLITHSPLQPSAQLFSASHTASATDKGAQKRVE